MKLSFQVLITFCLSLLISCSPEKKTFQEKDISIIPEPVALKLQEGSFVFDQNTSIVVSGEEQLAIASVLLDKFEKAAGWRLQTVKEKPENNYLLFQQEESLEEEAYELQVTQDHILIKASSYNGFLYGLESIRMLLPPEIEKEELVQNVEWQIPAVEIKDGPRFQWRGLHLDVARHFLEKEYVLKVIDRLALLKMNTLHMHLVDDQGWRLEIKKYPKLTEVGAFRVDHSDKHWNARPEAKPGEEATYGGFYTQEEMKEIVAYAQKRGIQVVPEIEMPAHVMSAIAAYPELSCHGKQISVPTGGVWPITDIYCAGKENTFNFLEEVLTEVMEIFPSKYIHVGGDEATKTNWESCPHCQKRMSEEGLSNVEELQSYFIKRMEGFLNEHDRVLVGWDEILEGGLAPRATVMSWRGMEGGWEASKQGHDVIMTPVSHMYFDYYQGVPDSEPVAFGGYTTLNKVYHFDPVVDSMSVEQKEHVIGAQANMWSEYIPDAEHSEYMMFPRLAALAEVVWSPEEARNWKDFSQRIKPFFKRLEYMDVNYAKSAFAVTAETQVDLEKNMVRVSLENEFPDSEIHYALGSENLSASSPVYSDPLEFENTTKLQAAVFENGEQQGETMTRTFKFHKAVGKPVSYLNQYSKSYSGAGASNLVNVLRGSLNFHDGQWQGWIPEDMEVIIDMENTTAVHKVIVGSMENQGAGIYYPTVVEVYTSEDGETYQLAGSTEREFQHSGEASRKDFAVEFDRKEARFLKVRAQNLGHPPTGGGAWLFVDEIVVE